LRGILKRSLIIVKISKIVVIQFIVQIVIVLTVILLVASAWSYRKHLRRTSSEILMLQDALKKLETENLVLRKRHEEHMSHQWNAMETIDEYVKVEQDRIATEMHDDTVQRMVVVRFRLEQLQYFGLNEKGIFEVDAMRQELEDTIKNLHFLIKGIPNAHFNKLSFSELMTSFYEKIHPVFTKEIEFEIQNPELEFELKPECKLELYRIVQEAVQNAMKHSLGDRLKIYVSWDESLQIEISDNGIGRWTKEDGMGSASMKARANRIGAKLEILNSTRGMYLRVSLARKTDNRLH